MVEIGYETTITPEEYDLLVATGTEEYAKREGQPVCEIVPTRNMTALAEFLGKPLPETAIGNRIFYLFVDDRERLAKAAKIAEARRTLAEAETLVSKSKTVPEPEAVKEPAKAGELTNKELVEAIRAMGGTANLSMPKPVLQEIHDKLRNGNHA